MPNRTFRPRVRRPAPVPGPRLVNRAADALEAVESTLERLRDGTQTILTLPRREQLETLLATAERATSRVTGPWNRPLPAEDRPLTCRAARRELDFAALALTVTLHAARRAAPKRPRRLSPSPQSRAIVPPACYPDGVATNDEWQARRSGGSPPGGPRIRATD